MVDELRAAAEALNRGDPEPFAALFAEDARVARYLARASVVERHARLTRPRRGP